MDSQKNINQGRDQFIINQPGKVQIDASFSGQLQVSVTGLDTVAPKTEKWIDRTQSQAQLLQRIESKQCKIT